MATFNFTVDTKPMAKEIDSVSSSVNKTTGAVVAMQAAVISAENAATEHVCGNLNKGFYMLIQSQISQKKALYQSEVDSLIIQLTQQKKALLNIRNRMERDYNMISRRYNKLFTGLNTNLRTRVNELDKPIMNFACKEMEKVSNRTKYLTATVPVTQIESLSTSQKIIASHVKHKGIHLINSMKGFLYEMLIQKKLTDQILINDLYSQKEGSYYLPVLLSESVSDSMNKRNLDIVIPKIGLNTPSMSSVRNTVFTGYSKLKWNQKSPSSEVNSEFQKLLSASQKSDRIKKMAQKLFDAANTQTL
jgi:hypothetical protein